MSVNENLTDSGTWISLAATPEDKALLTAIAKRDGNSSQSATVRRLIREEAARRGIVTEPAPTA